MQLLLFTNAWASAVITYELCMSMCNYYFWVPHEHEQLLLLSKAWAWAVIPYELRMGMWSY